MTLRGRGKIDHNWTLIGAKMFKTYNKEAAFAVEAVSVAAKLCRQIQREMVLPAVSKEDRSPVTVADFASQAVIARMMMKTFPEFTLVGEEGSNVLRTDAQEQALESVTAYTKSIFPEATPDSVCEWIDLGAGEVGERYWTVDPIDGTKGFLRGDQYVVALALVVNGKVVVGALGCPTLNREFIPLQEGEGLTLIAVRGEGTWAREMEGGEFEPIHVSDCSNPGDARILRSFESGHTDEGKMERLAQELGIETAPVLMDSSAKYALLAAGKGDLIFRLVTPLQPDYTEKIWDHAAGSLIVEEAGGRITDLRGKTLDFSVSHLLERNIGVLASNGHLHEDALEALVEVGADQRPEVR
jgi:3'(2'), 5'-bisphosphate nucleotidase